MAIEDALLRLGSSIATIAAKAWLDERKSKATRKLSLIELVQARGLGLIPQRRLSRQLEQLAETISERLTSYVSVEFSALPENEKIAALSAVSEVLETADLTDSRLMQADLSASGIYQIIQPAADATRRRAGLSGMGSSYFEAVLREAVDYLTEVIVSLPSFQGRALAELLARENSIIDGLRDILSRMPQRAIEDHGARAFELEYRREVARKLDQVEIFGVTFDRPSRRYSLSVAYIGLSAADLSGQNPRLNSTQGGSHSNSTDLPVESVLAQYSRLFIRGEAGSGKTTLLRWLAVKAAQQSFEGTLEQWNGKIPFLIQLRRYHDRDLPTVEQFASDTGWQLAGERPAGWITTVLREGRGLVLIDGVDELPEQRLRAIQVWLEDLVNSFSRCQYVITSRPSVVADDWLAGAAFSNAELQPMSPGHVRLFIRHWHDAAALDAAVEERAELEEYRLNLTAVVDANRAIRNLATNPLLCALICALSRDRRSQLPRRRMELYQTAIEMLLSRRDTERSIPDPTGEALSLEDKLQLLSDLAYWFTITGLAAADVERVENQVSLSLRDMAGKKLDTSAVYKYLLVRTGLLREPVPGHVDFVHKTFQEYLAARKIVETDSLDMLEQRFTDDSFREVVIMAAGHARRGEQERLLGKLLRKTGSTRKAVQKTKLRLLATSCLETATRISPALHAQVLQEVRRILPPRSMHQARALAASGADVVPLLSTSGLSAQEAAASIRTAGLIGGADAIEYLKRVATEDRRPVVSRELVAVWPFFEPIVYAREVLSSSTALSSEVVVTEPELLPAVKTVPFISVACQFSGEVRSAELAELSGMENLRAVRLAGVDQVTSLRWLKGHRSISVLEIGQCRRIRNIDAVGSLESLTSLTVLDGGESLSYAPISEASSLQHLDIGPTTLDELESLLDALPRLKSLRLKNCRRLQSIDQLGSHNELRRLELDACGSLRSLSGLANFPKLRGLAIVDCPSVDSLAPLVGASQLHALTVQWCLEIASLDSLSSLTQLRDLSIQGSRYIRDVAALSELVELRRLRLTDLDRLRDVSCLQGLNNLTLLDLSNSGSGLDTNSFSGRKGLRVIV
jgi:hypothetical protein